MEWNWIDHFSRAGVLSGDMITPVADSIRAGDDEREYQFAALVRTTQLPDEALRLAATKALTETLHHLLPKHSAGQSAVSLNAVIQDLLFCLWHRIDMRALLPFVKNYVGHPDPELCESACRFVTGVLLEEKDWDQLYLLLGHRDRHVRRYSAHSVSINETALHVEDLTLLVPALTTLAAGRPRSADALAARQTLNNFIRTWSKTRLDPWIEKLSEELVGTDRDFAEEAAELLTILSERKVPLPATAVEGLVIRAEVKREAQKERRRQMALAPNPGIFMLGELFREQRSWPIESRSMTDVDELFRDDHGNYILINFSPRENINYSEKKLTPEEALEIMREKYPGKFD